MRQKLRYTKSQIQNGLYTTGKEWQLEDGTEYIGLYHRYTTGEVYTQAVWSPTKSVALFEYTELSETVKTYNKLKQIDVNFQSIQSFRPAVTKDDNIITRYFLSKQNEFNIIEINKTQFELYSESELDNILYAAVSVPWKVSGKIRTIDNNGVLEIGIYEHNINSIQQAKHTVPNIERYLTDPLELATDIEFDVAADINQ